MFSPISALGRYLFGWDSIEPGTTNDISESPALLEHYRTTAFILQFGSNDINHPRPALPPELVAYIMRLAECRLPSSLTITHSHDMHLTSSGPLESHIWFHTPPFTRTDISKIWGIQLSTISTNQGWISDPNAGCWSWFEVAIYTPTPPDEIPTRGEHPNLTIGEEVYFLKASPDHEGENLNWISHRNGLYQRDTHLYDGLIFGYDHEIWSYLSPGDRIVVLAVARFPMWTNRGEGAQLNFWEFFDPSSSYTHLR